MAQLTLAGSSGDGQRLLLVDDAGQEFTLTVDARLRAALLGDNSRIGQLEFPMESTLRPRDIQTRIRAGESPETVAQAAQSTVEKIMPFAAPVLAERAHVAALSQSASVRRRGADAGARTLGEAVSAQLREHNVDPDTVEWDAWRREDGRWTLTALFESPARSGVATFAFDMRGNFTTLDDDDARWLVGDLAANQPSAQPSAESPADEFSAARARRLSAVQPEAADGEAPLGEDAISMVGEIRDDTAEVSEASAPVEPAAATPEPRPAKKRGRASVPSWDEIMFGGGKGE